MIKIIAMVLCLGVLITPSLQAQEEAKMEPRLEKATFAGGCFWCMQPFFDRLKGVRQTVVGYTGGTTENPTYEDVSSGTTGHAEAIEVTYDPAIVNYEKILTIYWHNINPTTLNQQFYDHGTQYRTAIFYHSEEQKLAAEQSKKALEGSKRFDKPIVTEIVKAGPFYPAEEYHQKYYQKNTNQYNRYHQASGRDQYLEKTWDK